MAKPTTDRDHLDVYRTRLLDLRVRLCGEMGRMADAALSQNRSETSSLPIHLADLGSDNFEQELTLSLVGSEKEALDQIEFALGRIADGSYGKCEDCGNRSPGRGWRPSPTRPCACSARRSKSGSAAAKNSPRCLVSPTNPPGSCTWAGLREAASGPGSSIWVLFRSRLFKLFRFLSTSIEALVMGLSLSLSVSNSRQAGELLQALVADVVVFQAEGRELRQPGEVLQAGVADPRVPKIEEFQLGQVLQVGQSVVVGVGFADFQPLQSLGGLQMDEAGPVIEVPRRSSRFKWVIPAKLARPSSVTALHAGGPTAPGPCPSAPPGRRR